MSDAPSSPDRRSPTLDHSARRWSLLIVAGILLIFLLLRDPETLDGPHLRVAVASNFLPTAKALASIFEEETGYCVSFSAGSSGKLYAQIMSGAPFDLFLSADVERPRRLEKAKRTVAGTRRVYAIGQLAISAPGSGSPRETARILEAADFSHFAIPNPRLAPYGRAAREVLVAMGLWEKVSDRIVVGENVAQTWHFLESGHAEAGLVALSQVLESDRAGPDTSFFLPPGKLHSPIEQGVVLLVDSPAGRAFHEFLRSDGAIRLIAESGYLPPPEETPGVAP